MLKLKNNKKAAGVDNIWIAITFFGLAIFFITLMVFWSAVNTGMADIWGGSSVGTQIQANGQAAVDQFDWILVVVWLGFHLGILATAFLLRSHPVVYVVAILLVGILALLAAPLSNAYMDMTADSELSAAASNYPMTNYILENYPKVEVIWAFVTVVVMFGLARMEGFV